MSEFETLRYEVADRILTITMNRPERLNAFNSKMQREFLEALDRADSDDSVLGPIWKKVLRPLITIIKPMQRKRSAHPTRAAKMVRTLGCVTVVDSCRFESTN